jgi:hypothetical protein
LEPLAFPPDLPPVILIDLDLVYELGKVEAFKMDEMDVKSWMLGCWPMKICG